MLKMIKTLIKIICAIFVGKGVIGINFAHKKINNQIYKIKKGIWKKRDATYVKKEGIIWYIVTLIGLIMIKKQGHSNQRNKILQYPSTIEEEL